MVLVDARLNLPMPHGAATELVWIATLCQEDVTAVDRVLLNFGRRRVD